MKRDGFDYSSSKWKKKSEKIKRRDHYQCVICKRYGRLTEAKVVHHIKDSDEYPEIAWDDKNLISLCMACHNKIHPEKGKKSLYRQDRRY